MLSDPTMRRLLIALWGLLVTLAVSGTMSTGEALAQYPERGYQSRPCGFDLDDDGILGEPEDCRVCRAGILDPDDDGVPEDQIFVDCQAGRDSPVCGSPGNPCRSLRHALLLRVDGPDDGAEDIVCFRGTCSPDDLTPATSGVPGHHLVARKATEARAFEYPSDPAMLVGWDTDNDGEYPPYDRDDTAVLDGRPGRLSMAFSFNRERDNDHFEVAHFEVRDYNRWSATDEGGFMQANRSRATSHLYVHDLELRGVNQDKPLSSGTIAFNMFGAQQLRWFALENILALDTGGYFMRGSGSDGGHEAGPFRLKNIEGTAHGCNAEDCASSAFIALKLWGYVTGLEVLDSRFDCNVGAWNPSASFVGCGGFSTLSCLQDALIQNNELIDFALSLDVGFSEGFCKAEQSRPVDGIVYNANRTLTTHDAFAPLVFTKVQTGEDATVTRSVRDVTITNNLFWTDQREESPGFYQHCLWYNAGNDEGPNPGTITFAHNTCFGETRSGIVALDSFRTFGHQSFRVWNNIFAGTRTGRRQIGARYIPSDWQSDGNTWGAGGRFLWPGVDSEVPIERYRAASGADSSSDACAPQFENPLAGDLRLRLNDGCAQARGQSLDSLGQVNLDLTRRPRRRANPDRGPLEVRIGDRPSIDLLGGRYRAAVQWRGRDGTVGDGTPGELSDESAFFWFFRPENVEVVLKVLDGCQVNDSIWVFGAGLTNVEAGIRVEDRLSDEEWSYRNRENQPFAPVQDTRALDGCE